MKTIRNILGSALLALAFASPASANVIFSISATAGPYSGSGTMEFADGSTGEIVGTSPNWISFNFTINGEDFALGDMFNASNEGVILDASSNFVSWSDGLWVEFQPNPPSLVPTIGFSTSGNAFYYSDVTFQDTTGTWTVSRVPEPATLALLGIGLAGLAATQRRKTH